MSPSDTLVPVDLVGARLSDAVIRGLDLRGMDLAGGRIERCRIEQCNMQGLIGAEFVECTVVKSHLDIGEGMCSWSGCSFDACIIRLYGGRQSRLRPFLLRLPLLTRTSASGLLRAAERVLVSMAWPARRISKIVRQGGTKRDLQRSRRALSILGIVVGISLIAAALLLLRPDPGSMSVEELSMRAANLSIAGRPRAAAELYRYILNERASAEDRPAFRLRLAGSLVEAGDFDGAISIYEEIISDGSATPEIYIQTGALIETSRGQERALEFYENKLDSATDPALREVIEGQIRRIEAQAPRPQ